MSGVAVVCLAASLAAQAPLALDVEHDRDVLKVSFQLLEPLPEAIETALSSGAVVRVRYPLRVRNPRLLWWDGKVWKGEVVATTSFDPITGRYRCEVVLDGVIVSSHELDSAEAARDFLKSPGPVLLSLPPTKKAKLWVKVRAVFSSSTKWLLFPSVEGTKWVDVPITPEPQTKTEGEPATEAAN
jgi:hypothetical protein